MMRLSTRNLAFKAEMLKQYGDSQWELLKSQGFSEDESFRSAAKEAIISRSRSLLRSDSEWFCALDLDGKLAFSVDRAGAPWLDLPAGLVGAMRKGRTGSVVFGSGGGRRYGQAFFFEPFGWYIVASDKESSIFAETERMTSVIVATFALAILISTFLLVRLTASIARPIEEVSAAMTDVMRSGDFGRSIAARQSDEVGALAMSFNALCRELDRSYEKMSDIAVQEAESRAAVAQREIEALIALGKVSEFRDQSTGQHIIRVGLYAKLLAEFFYESKEDRRIIYYAAPLHDIGKIGIPDSILLKEGPLTKEEFGIMKTHAAIGHSILAESQNPNLAVGAAISLSHHERYDGKGYPQGLSGTAIPLCGRIVAVIDVFDAFSSKRPYKEAWPVEKAFDYLDEQRGGHFDPDVVEAFLSHKTEVMAIWKENQ